MYFKKYYFQNYLLSNLAQPFTFYSYDEGNPLSICIRISMYINIIFLMKIFSIVSLCYN